MKLKKQNDISAYEFSWFRQNRPRKLYVPHTTFLEFQLLFHVPFLLRIFFSKCQTTYFSALFEKEKKRINSFYKIKEKKCMCTWNFSGSPRKLYVRCTMCCPSLFWLSCKMTKIYVGVGLYAVTLRIHQNLQAATNFSQEIVMRHFWKKNQWYLFSNSSTFTEPQAFCKSKWQLGMAFLCKS